MFHDTGFHHTGSHHTRSHVRAHRRLAACAAIATSTALLIVGPLAASSLVARGADDGGDATFGDAFSVDWYSVDCGGGVGASPGGEFSLLGSIGQPDAGTMAGGTFTLTGGFLAIAGATIVRCPADLDGDGNVGPQDLAILLGAWGNAGGAEDLSGNGAVGPEDLGILLGSWGSCV